MAKSLVCKQCNALLKNVAEAQTHNEITGHVQFEESTEAIKILMCTECGKPCRSQAERDLHTKFTGHATYVDKSQAVKTLTGEAPVLNTEAEMKEAKASMEEDEELLAEALGKKIKKKPASESGVGPQNEEEMVAPEVDEKLVKELEEMGFPTNRSIRAIHFSGATTVEAAVNWVVEHEGDADIDDPLFVPKASIKPKLTPEEARRQAEELVRKAREKREREEKEEALRREKERIRIGKELLKAKEKEDEMAMKRMIEQRQREKEADQRAREELKRKLEEDRKERRRKLGLPEELTEEEKAKEAEKLRQQAEADAAKAKVLTYVKPVSAIQKMRDRLVHMKKAHLQEEDKFKTACSTLLKYLGNIVANPDEDKYRSIKMANAAFQQRVAVIEGHLDFLEICGFQKQEEVLYMPREQVNMDLLNAAGSTLNDALTNPFFGVL